MRMEPVEAGGVRFVNDAYNANPASTMLALDQFDLLDGGGRKVVVLGEMKELGEHAERLHARVGERVARMRLDLFVAVGNGMAAAVEALRDTRATSVPVVHVESADEAAERLSDLLRPGDLVLLKGSRAVGLERVLERLSTRPAASKEAACSPTTSRPI